MGLDMFLRKVKRIKDATLNELLETNRYIDWLNECKNEYTDCSPEEWNGCNETLVRKDLLNIVQEEYVDRYYVWDTEHKCSPIKSIEQEIAYWRKANAIHRWFVENVQDGSDDCKEYEVTKEQLQELLDTCIKVKQSCNLVSGKVWNGTRWTKETGEVDVWEDGKVIVNASIARELLPTGSGFFFGGTDYDQWYYEKILITIDQLTKVLNETDFDNWIVYYEASW